MGGRLVGTMQLEEGLGMATATGAVRVKVGRRELLAARRGWGQGVKVRGLWTWPSGRPTRGYSFRDSITDQLRHAIAWHARSSHAIALDVGITPATMDRFMQGHDNALSFSVAALVARIVGVRLIDQRIVTGLLEERGDREIVIPRRNSLARRPASSRR